MGEKNFSPESELAQINQRKQELEAQLQKKYRSEAGKDRDKQWETTTKKTTLHGKSLESVYDSDRDSVITHSLFWGDMLVYRGDEADEMFDLLVENNIDPSDKDEEELRELLRSNKDTEKLEMAKITDKIQSSLSKDEWEKVKNFFPEK